MRTFQATILLLLPTLIGAQTTQNKCPAASDGIVLHAVGAWQPQVRILQKIDIETLQLGRDRGEIAVLAGGLYFHKVCASPNDCKSACPPLNGSAEKRPAKELTADATGALRSMEGRPEFREPMSRAAGWADAVIGSDSEGTIDLAPVFAGSRRGRTLEFRICELDRIQCSEPQQIVWDEKSAIVKGQKFGDKAYRVVSKDGANEAWIRVTPIAQADALRKSYDEALSAIDTWDTPPGLESRAILDRLQRMILAGIGGER